MKTFEARCTPTTPQQSLPHIKYHITRDFFLQSHALLCKNPIEGYMNVTGLPREIVETILIDYVGLIYINKYSSTSSSQSSGKAVMFYKYREMNMNAMRTLINQNKNTQNWGAYFSLIFKKMLHVLTHQSFLVVFIAGILLSSLFMFYLRREMSI